MNVRETAETVVAVLAALGGGGAIVFGLSNYLGRVWADRGLERQRHEYSQLNIAFQSQLDIATRRLQVELDALGLVHKLRTEEEFTRLAGLWKRMANLRNYFGALARQGLTLSYADPEAQKRWKAQMRQQFSPALNDAQMFLSEEALFIPKHICDTADKAIKAALEETFHYVAFSPYLETSVMPGAAEAAGVADMRRQYYDAQAKSFESFTAAVEQLETIMREHISGTRFTPAQTHEG